jgi:hypothetical protein
MLFEALVIDNSGAYLFVISTIIEYLTYDEAC